MKGWYGDKERHSLASRGIKTSIKTNYIQYKQEPSDELVNELEHDLQSLYANGFLKNRKVKKEVKRLKKESTKEAKTTIKTSTAEVKKLKKDLEGKEGIEREKIESDIKWEESKVDNSKSKLDIDKRHEKSLREKKREDITKDVKSVLSTVGSAVLSGTKELIQMGKEMKDSSSIFMDIPEDETALPQATIVALKNETIKIDNDIKVIDQKTRDKKKEINEKEKQDKEEFIDWYKGEKYAYEQTVEGLHGSGMDNRELRYELEKEEILFKAKIEKNKHLLYSMRAENDADIELLRDLKTDLRRLKGEIKKRVSAG